MNRLHLYHSICHIWHNCKGETIWSCLVFRNRWGVLRMDASRFESAAKLASQLSWSRPATGVVSLCCSRQHSRRFTAHIDISRSFLYTGNGHVGISLSALSISRKHLNKRIFISLLCRYAVIQISACYSQPHFPLIFSQKSGGPRCSHKSTIPSNSPISSFYCSLPCAYITNSYEQYQNIGLIKF